MRIGHFPVAREHVTVRRRWPACLVGAAASLLGSTHTFAQDTVDAGVTGFSVKRPVLASACPHGCPWGELGDFLQEVMAPAGYDIVLCRNCNRAEGPRLVATAALPPELTGIDTFVGTTTRVNAPVDFGITSSNNLGWAYAGLHDYAEDGPFANLRLIARIEDPRYVLAAVKADSGITDLSQIAEQELPVTILGGGSPITHPILDHYGLTEQAVTAWGGVFISATIGGQADEPAFDLVVTENASPANNPEAAYWTKITEQHDVRFLELPEEVLDELAADATLGVERAVVEWGFLRGVDRPIPTVVRSGHVVFSRDDMPEDAAYDAAQAIDEHREMLRWFIRPYSYDTRTAFENMGVPLHPGAERYYREVGYLATGGCGFGDNASASRYAGPVEAPIETADVGETGFDVKKPVLASACPEGCPWGELGDFVREAMAPLGYEVLLCRNCNRAEGPRLVGNAAFPPELGAADTVVGTTLRIDAPVDFGVTESGMLAAAFHGRGAYAEDGPYANLRLIAKVEDPYYVLVAVRADANITDLSQIAEQQLPVKIMGGDSEHTRPILEYYGITPEALQSWGGSMQNAIVAGVLGLTDFDVIVSELASPANNPESAYWTTMTYLYDMGFLDLPDELLDDLAADDTLGLSRATAKWGLLRGIDREIPTVVRSGEAIFGRDDMPDDVAYDVAKAVDEYRAALRTYIRPYSYDSRTAWENFDVPLHPGAERYYRDVGYLPGAEASLACTDAGVASDAGNTSSEPSDASGSCGCDLGRRAPTGSWAVAIVVLVVARRRRGRRAAPAEGDALETDARLR